MIRFLSLTSGSCGNCYFVGTENEGVLIDAGIGGRTIRKRLKEAGVDMSEVKAVFITHDHSDHICGVGSLAEIMCKPVYSSEKVLKNLNNNYRVNPKVMPASMHRIHIGETVKVAGLEIHSFCVPHDAHENNGYVVRAENETIVIATDVGYITEDVKKAMNEANYLVIESNYDEDMLNNGSYSYTLKQRIRGGNGHLSNEQCCEYLERCSTKKLRHVFLCHLSQNNNTVELAYNKAKQALRKTSSRYDTEIKLDVLKRGKMSPLWIL